MSAEENQELRDLRARVRSLESENALLAERTESLVLLSAVRRAFEDAESMEAALERMAELCRAIVDVETTCVLLDDAHDEAWPQALRSHCGSGEGGCPVFARIWADTDLRHAGSTHVVGASELSEGGCLMRPEASVAVAFERASLGRGVLLFGGGADVETLRARTPRFEELGAMLADLIEARTLRDALERARATLERKVAERTAELDIERARLATILDCAAGGIVETSLKGQIISSNRAFQELLGYDAEELVGKTWMELTHPDDLSVSVSDLDALLRGEIPSYAVDKRYLRKDGSVLEAQARISITRDAGAQAERHIAIVHDVGPQREAERSLRRLSHAVEQSHDAIALTDRGGRIQYVNAAFEAGSGYTLEEVRGKTPRLLKSGMQNDAFYRELWATISSGQTWQGRFVNKRKDGSLFTEESMITPVLDAQGEVEGYVAVKRDLTERLALEEQLRQSQKLEAIGQLAGGIAHDFNNLLMPVLVDGEMLAEELGADDPRRDLAQEILEAAERAKVLTRQLLAFSRRQVLDVRAGDLSEIVTGFGQVLRRVLREDVEVVFDTPEEPAPVEADLGQLEQVLMNLVVNAQDAMPMGGELHISVLANAETPEHLEGARWVAFEVRDTGEGMSPDTLRRATEPFFTTKDRGKGTGLGLSTCHGIATQHGGDLRITSAPGEGTSVRVTLPRFEGAEQRPKTPPRAASIEGHGARRRGRRIWLVEDDSAVARSTERLLRSVGAEVMHFASSSELLDLLDSLEPADLLLADVILPGMDGHALHQRLRQTLPALPAVFVSGYPDEVLSPHGVLDGDLHFVQKPYSSERLLREVEAALSEVEAALSD